MKRIIEAIVDLVFPPEPGDPELSFRAKLVVFILLILIVALAFLLAE